MPTDVAHTCATGLSLTFKEDKFPNRGIYCATDARFRSTITLHHCQTNGLLSPKCAAVNYNVSDTTCTEISTPCTLAINDPTMEYIMFNKRVHSQCFTWVMLSEVTENHTRQVYNTNGDVRPEFYIKVGFIQLMRLAAGATLGQEHTESTMATMSLKSKYFLQVVLQPGCFMKLGCYCLRVPNLRDLQRKVRPHTPSCLHRRESLTCISLIIIQ